jgi:hypothetical protein
MFWYLQTTLCKVEARTECYRPASRDQLALHLLLLVAAVAAAQDHLLSTAG